jgi:hypothetical protein
VKDRSQIVFDFWLKLVKCVENRKNSENCKQNFVGFVVKSATTFVILTWSDA